VTFGEASTAQETLDHARRQDWMWPSWISACPEKVPRHFDDLKRLRPRLPILLLSMHPEQQFARRALKPELRVLDKRRCAEELKEAIRKLWEEDVM